MKYIKCNICNEENEQNSHYCNNCGKNLSNNIEKTDVLFFLSSAIKVLGIIILLFVVPGCALFDLVLSLDGGITHVLTISVSIICLIIFIISFSIKKYTLKLCKKNLNN